MRTHKIIGLIMLCYGVSSTAFAADPVTEAKGRLAGRQYGAVLEVLNAEFVSERPAGIGEYVIRQYSVEVKVNDKLPPSENRKNLTLIVERAEGMMAERLGLQNWFPLERGAQFVTLFDEEKPTHASDLDLLALGNEVRPVWADCVRFFKIASLPENEMREALIRAMQKNRPELGLQFFLFLRTYYDHIYGSKDVSLALANYLTDGSVPISLRIRVIKSAFPPESKDAEAAIALANALTKCIFDSAGTNQSVGNLFDKLFGRFVSQNIFPNLDKEGRTKLRKLMGEGYIFKDRKIVEKCEHWLDSE